jgi:hypothetical protein
MGELGIVRYAYWSDRRMRGIAADDAIALDTGSRRKARSAKTYRPS